VDRRSGRSVGLAMVTVLAVLAVSASCAKDAEVSGPAGTSPPATFQVALDKEATAGAPRSGGDLKFGLAAETSGWNPYIGQWAGSAYIVAGTIFDPLAAVDPQGNAKPYLAESFTPSSDFKQWKIRLRPGVSFHNGERLDSAAVKTNLELGRKSGLTAQA